MPVTLATVLRGLETPANEKDRRISASNASLIRDFYLWMKENDKSEAYMKNQLKAMINFAQWLYKSDASQSLLDMDRREIVLQYLDTKVRSEDDDPDGKWITTWNDYLGRIKVFYQRIFARDTVGTYRQVGCLSCFVDQVKIRYRGLYHIGGYGNQRKPTLFRGGMNLVPVNESFPLPHPPAKVPETLNNRSSNSAM